MKDSAILSAMERVLGEQNQELVTKNNHLLGKVRNLEQENSNLSRELSYFYSRKFGRLVKAYYSSINDRRFIKKILKFFLNIILFSMKLIGVYGIDSEKKESLELEKKIMEIISANKSKHIIFYIAPVDWDIPLYQRPQHIAMQMSLLGNLYFYVVKHKNKYSLKEINNNCFEVKMKDLNFKYLINVIKSIPDRDVYIKTYSTELSDLSELEECLKDTHVKYIYEYVDEIDSSIAGREIPAHVIDKFEKSARDEKNTYIVATASKLYEDVAYYREKNFALITNGVEYEHFSQKFSLKELPFPMLKIFREGKPIVGYYGAIASWMDYELLKYMAKERPNYNFLIIGINYDGTLDSSGLEEYKNIHVLPAVNYKDLPRSAYFLDICMIPFKINEITKSTSPIKLFEYMALHKPIVTSDMPECRKYKSVLIGKSYEEFVKQIDKAISLRKDKSYINLLDKEAKENTWQQKAKDIDDLISS